MMIVENSKGALKERLYTVSLNNDSGPSAVCPTLVRFLDPRLALKNLVIVPDDRFGVGYLASRVYVLYRCSFRYDIVIRF